jgi:hypothetical protein
VGAASSTGAVTVCQFFLKNIRLMVLLLSAVKVHQHLRPELLTRMGEATMAHEENVRICAIKALTQAAVEVVFFWSGDLGKL